MLCVGEVRANQPEHPVARQGVSPSTQRCLTLPCLPQNDENGRPTRAHVSHTLILRRSDRRKDRVEISPLQLSEASSRAEAMGAAAGRPLRVIGCVSPRSCHHSCFPFSGLVPPNANTSPHCGMTTDGITHIRTLLCGPHMSVRAHETWNTEHDSSTAMPSLRDVHNAGREWIAAYSLQLPPQIFVRSTCTSRWTQPSWA